jgi:hypothetical protein
MTEPRFKLAQTEASDWYVVPADAPDEADWMFGEAPVPADATPVNGHPTACLTFTDPRPTP